MIGNIRNFAANTAYATAAALNPKNILENLTTKKVATFALEAIALSAAASLQKAEGGPIFAVLTFAGCVYGSFWGPVWFIVDCPEMAGIAYALPTP